MGLSDNLKGYLVSELRNVSEKMSEGGPPLDTNFYYSAAYGAVHRILNIEFEPRLMLLHTVLNSSYNQIQGRLRAERDPTPATVAPGVLRELASLMRQLSERIESNEDYVDVLEQICTVSYGATGNGFYLMRTGRIPAIEAPPTIF